MADVKKKNSAGGEKQGISFIDVAIILAVIAIAATLIARTMYSGSRENSAASCEISYTMSGVRYTFQDILGEGDTLLLDDGSTFGTLDTMTVMPAAFYDINENGETVEARYPEDTLIDISGTISASLYSAEGGYFTSDGMHISAGTVITLHTRTADISVTVTAVNAVG